MMFGQTTTGIDWQMVGLLASIVGNIALVGTLYFMRDRKREISPQPFEVKFAQEFASRVEFANHAIENKREHATFDRRIDGLDRTMREHIDQKLTLLQSSAEIGRSKLHDRIDEILEAVSELRGEVRAKRGI